MHLDDQNLIPTFFKLHKMIDKSNDNIKITKQNFTIVKDFLKKGNIAAFSLRRL